MGVDRGAASLTEKLSGGVVGGGGGVSGLQDRDYRAVSGSGGPEALARIQGAKVTRVPLPAELVEVNIDISSPAFEIYRGRVTSDDKLNQNHRKLRGLTLNCCRQVIPLCWKGPPQVQPE